MLSIHTSPLSNPFLNICSKGVLTYLSYIFHLIGSASITVTRKEKIQPYLIRQIVHSLVLSLFSWKSLKQEGRDLGDSCLSPARSLPPFLPHIALVVALSHSSSTPVAFALADHVVFFSWHCHRSHVHHDHTIITNMKKCFLVMPQYL